MIDLSRILKTDTHANVFIFLKCVKLSAMMMMILFSAILIRSPDTDTIK